MDPRHAASRAITDPDAVEFVRFCYRRRRVGWPELYDEMCAVAARGLFRGLDADDLAGLGIGFSLFDMPALAGLRPDRGRGAGAAAAGRGRDRGRDGPDRRSAGSPRRWRRRRRRPCA